MEVTNTRKRNVVRIISLILLIFFIIPSNVFASSLSTSEDQLNRLSLYKDAKIQSLLDERASLLATLFHANSADAKRGINSEIDNIDRLLEDQGAVFLTDSEAMTIIAEKEGRPVSDLVREDVPTSSRNTWISTRSSYTYQGVRHNVQTLTAQPKSSSSALASTGGTTLHFTNQWLAGSQNMISSLVETISGDIVSLFPGGSYVLLFADAFGSFHSAFTDDAYVNVDSIQYTWSSVVTASFKYVRLDSQDDSAQWLSLISTKAAIEVGYQTAGFEFTPNGQSQPITPTVTQGTRSFNVQPTNYNSNNLAVNSYYTYGGGGRQECVKSVKISGPESKIVKYIALCCPFMPSQCE